MTIEPEHWREMRTRGIPAEWDEGGKQKTCLNFDHCRGEKRVIPKVSDKKVRFNIKVLKTSLFYKNNMQTYCPLMCKSLVG